MPYEPRRPTYLSEWTPKYVEGRPPEWWRRRGLKPRYELYGAPPEVKAAIHKTYLSEDDKIARGYPLTIWDAARAYRETSGQSDAGLRAILKQGEFRDAWRTIRGGGLKGGTPTSNREKVDAAKVIGWYDRENTDEFYERLRNMSP